MRFLAYTLPPPVNAYKISSWKDLDLDLPLLLEMHKVATLETLDKPDAVGRLRREEEKVRVVDVTSGDILHEPPHASQLVERLQALCDFANEISSEKFIHPVIRSIILHFWLAYDHPFVDGNGRTARALFYWSLFRQNYWVFSYLSISEIILRAPVQYAKAFLYSETDDNDLTYFIVQQMKVIKRAFLSLEEYLQKETIERKEIESLLDKHGEFNSRQQALLTHAFKHLSDNYTIEAHKTSHGIAYDTARNDLKDLEKKGLLIKEKKGKAYVYKALFSFQKK